MKSFPQLLIVICAVISKASGLEDGKPWDNGTHVYNESPSEGGLSGTISSFNSTEGVYMVTWEDGTTDYYDDDVIIDEMVSYAQNDTQIDPVNDGSVEVSDPAGTEFGNDTYIVKWGEDAEIEEFENVTIMDQMVEQASSEDGKPWDDGTKVYSNESSSEGWLSGTISYFNSTEGVYMVTWEDGTTDYYESDDENLNQMVAYAKDNPENNPADAGSAHDEGAYPAGTAVLLNKEGEDPHHGVVVQFGSGTYTVKWDIDDEMEEIKEGPIMDQMVEQALSDVDGDELLNQSKESEPVGDILGNEEFILDREEEDEIKDGEIDESEDSDNKLKDKDYTDVQLDESIDSDNELLNQPKESEPVGDILGNEELILDRDEEDEIEIGEDEELVDYDNELVDNSYGVDIELDDTIEFELDEDKFADDEFADDGFDEKDDFMFDDDDEFADDEYADDKFDDDEFDEKDDLMFDEVLDDFSVSFDDDLSTGSFFARDDWWQIGGSAAVFFGLILISVCFLGSSAFGYKIYAKRRADRDEYGFETSRFSRRNDGFQKISF